MSRNWVAFPRVVDGARTVEKKNRVLDSFYTVFATAFCTWRSTTTHATRTSRFSLNEGGDTSAGFVARTVEHFADRGVGVERVMTDNARNYVDSGLLEPGGDSPRQNSPVPTPNQWQSRAFQSDAGGQMVQ